MTSNPTLDAARIAFDRREWTAAATAFAAADADGSLDAFDLGHAGLAAHLTGDDDLAAALMTRSHQAAVAAGDTDFAALMAFWLGMMLANRGDVAVAGGWLARAGRLVEERGEDSVVAGYLCVPQALQALEGGDPASALALFERAAAAAERFKEQDLAVMARLGRGQSLIDLGDVARGVALLDDAMLGVTSGEVSPVVTGIVYCAAIEAFHRVYDLRRAQGWTDALTRWLAEQPDLFPFRGRCLVYRADLMRFHGAWREAVEETRRARELLLRPPPAPAAGEAFYVDGELLRLRGDLEAAEVAYREASNRGRHADPGLARLRLAQRRPEAGLTMLLRAIDETPDGLARAPLLEAVVDLACATGDPARARAAADELVALAATADAPLLAAVAARADGSARLAAAQPREALAAFRRAWSLWQPLDAPHDAARVREGIGLACRALGDEETAAMELGAAREVFERLGAAPDVRRVDEASGVAWRIPGGLSSRELEVLRRLAEGRTNREIGAELGISERTVDRHVSNIYTKLDVSTRAAATAFAYEHDIV